MSVLFVVVPVVFVLIIAVAVIGLARAAADRKWFNEHGLKVNGEITNVRVKRSTTMNNTGDGGAAMTTSTRYIPTVRFTTDDGQLIETETPSSGRRPGRPGDVVLVAYDPADPPRARIMR